MAVWSGGPGRGGLYVAVTKLRTMVGGAYCARRLKFGRGAERWHCIRMKVAVAVGELTLALPVLCLIGSPTSGRCRRLRLRRGRVTARRATAPITLTDQVVVPVRLLVIHPNQAV